MSIEAIVTIVYFAVGLVLTLMWWNDEYKAEYEYEREEGEVEEPMAILLLVGLLFFWPIKLVKNYLESFVDA